MGFIERMAEAMKMNSTPQEPEPEARKEDTSKTAPALETEVAEAADVSNTSDQNADQENKTYSQTEIDKIIEERKKVWETERMNALSKDSQIEELKAELLKRDLKEKVAARLEEAKLPLGVGDLVQYTDEAGTMQNLEKTISLIEQIVQDGVNARLRGKTPEGLGISVRTHGHGAPDEFARAFSNAMKM